MADDIQKTGEIGSSPASTPVPAPAHIAVVLDTSANLPSIPVIAAVPMDSVGQKEVKVTPSPLSTLGSGTTPPITESAIPVNTGGPSEYVRPIDKTPSIQKVEPLVDTPIAEPPPLNRSAQTSAPIMPRGIEGDIRKILTSIKLPERTDQKGIADTRKKIVNQSIDDVLAQTVMSAPELSRSQVPNTPRVSPDATPVVKKEIPTETTSSVVRLHTLKDDLQNAVRTTKMSIVKAVALEEDRGNRPDRIAEELGQAQRQSRTRIIIFVSLLLLALGGAALFGVYIVMTQSHITDQGVKAPSIVFTESSALLPIDHVAPLDLKETLAQSREGTTATLGSITRIIPTITTNPVDSAPVTRAATLREFLLALGASPPDELLRALGDTYLFGIHTVDKNAPFFVIPVTSYDHAFSGMLAWENNMNAELAPAFTPIPTFTKDINGIPSHRVFQDAVMRNYDSRILKDDGNAVQLFYSFPTPTILIIGESPYTFTELLARLRSARQL